MGHIESAKIIINHERHLDRKKLIEDTKSEMKNFNFKKTDVRKGELISSDKHIKSVKERFE